MLSVPESVSRLVESHFPTVRIRWNDRGKHFEICEKRDDKYGKPILRRIAIYSNPDGSPAPIIGDRVVTFLHRADTRKWPMMERAKLWDKEAADKKAAEDRAFGNVVQSKAIEDFNYINGSRTFFMNPDFHFKNVGHADIGGIIPT